MDLEYNNTAIKITNSNKQEIIDFYISKGFSCKNRNINRLKNDENVFITYIGPVYEQNIYIIDDDYINRTTHVKIITLPIDIWI